ncbi:PQQ enzyme repeat protein [Caulifigura coniformis]|uniref:PQQ enzyme repeat protein n=1 Tax=Caulifigura coniformis TaxID=2527983 RepID=A0A517SE83_9PLAN|nr:PQQ-binding-like beta-propeller repeat protein [Caulifigura coniformis]QDT54433.1 PQQ enzyme repeat protein [Caulifigura coniformis]
MSQSFDSSFLSGSGSSAGKATPTVDPADLVFVGFNRRVCALHRDTGELVWSWKSPQGAGFVVLLYDTDRLIASVQGYTYCLDPATGSQIWSNPLKGFGLGVPCIASISGVSPAGLQAAGEQDAAQRSAS